jgi:membrane-associated protease RseP (regulator of RpoE activity)
MTSRLPRYTPLLAVALGLALVAPLAAVAGGDDDDGLRRVRVHRLVHGPGFGGPGTFLGVVFIPLTPELRRHWGVPEDTGLLVSKVVEDSPAARAGLEVGDVLTRVDGEAVEGFNLRRLIGRKDAGETVTIEVYRGGRAQTLSATLEKREFERAFERELAGEMPHWIARHGRHLGHGRALVLKCDGDGEDCTLLRHPELDCDGEEPCEIKVECKDGDCTCTVNGKASACADLGDDD